MIMKYFYLFSVTLRCVICSCGSIKKYACCPGYYWDNNTLACEVCPFGYHNINCSESCKFPSYGKDCQGTCKCAIKFCDYRFGCREYNSTTQIVNKITPSGTPLVIQGLPLTILFIIIALVGFFIILCGLFVGTYVYKHCKRQPTAVYPSLKQQDGYDSLALDGQQQIGHSSPPIFLEPVSDTCSNYDDIDN